MKIVNDDVKRLNESSLPSIWQHMNNDKSFSIVSASHGDADEEANFEGFRQLRYDVRKLGYGYLILNGGYTHQDTGKTLSEMSLFVPNIKRDELLKLGRRYQQESVIYKDENEFALLSSVDGSTFLKFQIKVTFAAEDLKNAFSSLVRANFNNQKQYAFVPDEDPTEALAPDELHESVTYFLEEWERAGWKAANEALMNHRPVEHKKIRLF